MNKFFKKLSKLFSKKSFSKYIEIFKVCVKSVKEALRISPTVTLAIIVINIVTYLIPILTTFITARVIDEITLSVELNTWNKSLVVMVLMFFTLRTVSTVINYLRGYLENIFALEYDRVLTLQLHKKFAELDFSYYESSNYNDLFQKARESVRYSRFLFFRVLHLLSNVASLITVLAVFLFYKPILVLLVILAGVPQFANELAFGQTKWGIWSSEGKTYRNYNLSSKLLSDSKSLRELRIFRTRKYLVDMVGNLYTRFNKKQRDVEDVRFRVGSTLEIISIFIFLISYISITNDVVLGVISVGMFTFYVTNFSNLSGTIGEILRYIASSYEAGLYVKDYYKVLALPIKIKSGNLPIKNVTAAPEISFENVSFKYPRSDEKVIENLNLRISPGEHVAIVGENGAGKTTLITLLQRFYDVTSGDIKINGHSLKHLKLEDWYKMIATLTQDYVKYHFSAQTNIGLGKIEELANIDSIKNAAEMTGADKFINKYDRKYNKILNKSFPGGVEPSEGQWQKVALARAFFKNSPILILDEPTSAIDPKAEYEIFQKLFEFAKDKTVIIISHRFSTVRNADRIIVMDGGKIVEEGSHKQLIEKGGLYKEAYDLQKKGYEDI